jgi:hypothetical protein
LIGGALAALLLQPLFTTSGSSGHPGLWAAFGPASFLPAVAGRDIEGFVKKGERFVYEKHGFEATRYVMSTDQLGTQLDPPAHWASHYPSIDELSATYTLRPLVVISIAEQVKSDYGYALQVSDILQFERRHGTIPADIRGSHPK